MPSINDLKNKYPSAVFSRAAATAKIMHPREVLAKLVDDSIKLLADPTYTIKVRGKVCTPAACYTKANGKAVVSLKYCRSMLLFDGVSNTITVDETDLSAWLDGLKEVINSKEFDAQLNAIKSNRTAALTAGAAKAKTLKAVAGAATAKKAA